MSVNCKDMFILKTLNFKTQRNFVGFELNKTFAKVIIEIEVALFYLGHDVV